MMRGGGRECRGEEKEERKGEGYIRTGDGFWETQ